METIELPSTLQVVAESVVKVLWLRDGKIYAMLNAMPRGLIGSSILLWVLTKRHVETCNSHQV